MFVSELSKNAGDLWMERRAVTSDVSFSNRDGCCYFLSFCAVDESDLSMFAAMGSTRTRLLPEAVLVADAWFV